MPTIPHRSVTRDELITTIIGALFSSVLGMGVLTPYVPFIARQSILLPALILSCAVLLYGLVRGMRRHDRPSTVLFGIEGCGLLLLAPFSYPLLGTIGAVCTIGAALLSLFLPTRIDQDEMLDIPLDFIESSATYVIAPLTFGQRVLRLQRFILPFVLGGIAAGAAFGLLRLTETAPAETTFMTATTMFFVLCLLLSALCAILYFFFLSRSDLLERYRKHEGKKSSFVRMAADSMRTPLTGMRWFTELLLQGDMGTLTPEQRESFGDMSKSINRMIGITNEILNIIHLSGGFIQYHPRPADINEIVSEVVHDVRHVARARHIGVGFGKLSDDFGITLDVQLIHHLLETLVSNTIQLADKHTEIVLHVEPIEHQTNIGISYQGRPLTLKPTPTDDPSKVNPGVIFADTSQQNMLDLTVSWEILGAARGKFWLRDASEKEHTLFIALPKVPTSPLELITG